MTVYNAAVLAAGPMPARIAALPVTAKGYPVPWFAAKVAYGWDLRVVDTTKIKVAWDRKRCWVCGQQLGRTVAAAMGPMCVVNRTTSEPPSHRECAEFSMRACPFLSNPRMRRNEDDMPIPYRNAPGIPIERNPGVMAIWLCRHYRPFRTDGGYLWEYGEPTEVLWFTAGRPATRQEVVDATDAGLPALRQVADLEGPPAVAELQKHIERARRFFPQLEHA